MEALKLSLILAVCGLAATAVAADIIRMLEGWSWADIDWTLTASNGAILFLLFLAIGWTFFALTKIGGRK